MNEFRKLCANCKYWALSGTHHEDENNEFSVEVGFCAMREAYTDEFYICPQWEPKEEMWD